MWGCKWIRIFSQLPGLLATPGIPRLICVSLHSLPVSTWPLSLHFSCVSISFSLAYTTTIS